MALCVAGSGRNPPASVGCSRDHICSEGKRMPAFQEKVQLPLCLRCWNSAVRRNYLLVICQREEVYSASCAVIFKKKNNPKPKSCQCSEVVRAEWDFWLLLTSVYFPKASGLVESSPKEKLIYPLEVVKNSGNVFICFCTLILIKLLVCDSKKYFCVAAYASSCPLDELLCVNARIIG